MNWINLVFLQLNSDSYNTPTHITNTSMYYNLNRHLCTQFVQNFDCILVCLMWITVQLDFLLESPRALFTHRLTHVLRILHSMVSQSHLLYCCLISLELLWNISNSLFDKVSSLNFKLFSDFCWISFYWGNFVNSLFTQTCTVAIKWDSFSINLLTKTWTIASYLLSHFNVLPYWDSFSNIC